MKSFAKRFRVLRVARLATPLLAYCLGNMPAVAAGIRTVHVFVALADNQHQGIVPVPARLGNGQDAAANLYWGAAYGVKSYFKSSADWKLISCQPTPRALILERCIFHQPSSETYLVADAYDGARIRDAIVDFLSSSAGVREESASIGSAANKSISIAGKAGPGRLRRPRRVDGFPGTQDHWQPGFLAAKVYHFGLREPALLSVLHAIHR